MHAINYFIYIAASFLFLNNAFQKCINKLLEKIRILYSLYMYDTYNISLVF